MRLASNPLKFMAKVVLLRDLEQRRSSQKQPTPALTPRQVAVPDRMVASPVTVVTKKDSPSALVLNNSSHDIVMVDSPQAVEDTPEVSSQESVLEPYNSLAQPATESSSRMENVQTDSQDASDQHVSLETTGPTDVRPEVAVTETSIVLMDTSEDNNNANKSTNDNNNGLNIDFGSITHASSTERASEGHATNDEAPANPHPANTNFAQTGVGSLLPGLEVYANDDEQDVFGDITDVDKQSPTNDFGENGLAADDHDGMTNAGGQDGFETSGAGDGSTFEDLFDFGDFGGTDGNTTSDAQATFDDSQFGADFFNI